MDNAWPIRTLEGKEVVLPDEVYDLVADVALLARPLCVELVLGTERDRVLLAQRLIASATFLPVPHRPDSFLVRTHPDDVARMERKTFMCSAVPEEVGPTNNRYDPNDMMLFMRGLFAGCMEGKSLYVVPFLMGRRGSPLVQVGVELTDSPYVAYSMTILAEVSDQVLREISSDGLRCVHSVGVPKVHQGWPCRVSSCYVAHFPEQQLIWSFGSGYGGNALLHKKSCALRLASWQGKQQGWLVGHMAILGVTSPEGNTFYLAAALPSACGKTHLALLHSLLPGWTVSCVGDDIAWLWWDEEGRCRALNPERGVFAVAPGTSWETSPAAMEMVQAQTVFTNVAQTASGDIWWEGMDGDLPDGLVDWQGRPFCRGHGTAAHPNARFTTSMERCPSKDPLWESPQGVLISAIIFGSRRSSVLPLVRQATSWEQGVFFGASLSSEATAAADAAQAGVRRDPFAMLPFCGCHMADYMSHWLAMNKGQRQMPGVFAVNWFLRRPDGSSCFPGFSENMRVLAWMIRRLEGTAQGRTTPWGVVPCPQEFPLPEGCLFEELFPDALSGWREETLALRTFLNQLGDTVPASLYSCLSELEQQCL